VLTKWLGVLEAAVVFGGLAGLVTGMYLLATSPLPGVIVMLASMALLLSSVAKLAEAQELRQESAAGRERFSRSRAGSSSR
jgi:ribose/xylose/arabinose/galactoside ABC-type transport system permease subunit